MAADANSSFVEMQGIHRHFGSTHALRGVDLTLRPGEIHALLGANGAGKTTLVRILAGLDTPDEGSMSLFGEQVHRFDPRDMRAAGVALVQQHFTLVPTLSASENLRQAAENLAKSEGALHLRTLQTIRDIAADPSEKIVLFVPSDLGQVAKKLSGGSE